MQIENNIFGSFDIKEKVLIELIKSPAIQRLKDIDQAGYSKSFFEHSRNRYDHSIGVFLLLRKYGASLEEQMAGLIHDISHYAFSHAIDYILEEGDVDKQDLQDRSKEKFLKESNIPEILEKYGYDVEYIADEENFPLLEKPLPDLCADRLEYSIRDIGLFLDNGISKAEEVLKHLKVSDDNIWYFDDIEVGYKYAKYFKELNSNYYAGLNSVAMFKSLKDFIKHALSEGYISTKDLEEYDQYVLDKCLKHLDKDRVLEKYWKRMNDRELFYEDESNYEEVVYCKSRVIDPFCMVKGEMKMVSEVYEDWKEVVRKESIPKKCCLGVRDL
ncbi:HD domain-containing protein [bacterium]|nr:HD domain-containing protein [bacterium]